MNIENPYSPFTQNSLSAQLFDYQNLLALMHLSSLSSSFNEPMQPMSSSLNQKRCFPFYGTGDFNDMEFNPYMVQKKFKPDLDLYDRNMYQYQNRDFTNRNDFVRKSNSQAKHSNVVAVDDDQDCFIIEDSPSKNKEFNAQQNTQFKPLNIPENQYGLLKNYQFFNSDLRGLNSPKKHINKSQMLMDSRSSHPVEVIVIDNDDDDYVDLNTSTNKQSIRKKSIFQNNSPVSTLTSEYNSVIHLHEIPEPVLPIVDPHAVLPAFELSSRILHKIQPRRAVKSTWNPDVYDPQTFQTWLKGIESIVGIEITNEEKVMKVMKGFGMNIDSALRNIRRNKAHYKNYFRVQKLEKDRTSS